MNKLDRPKAELMSKISELVEEYENENETLLGVFLEFVEKEGRTWEECEKSVYEWNGEGFDELDKDIGVVKQYV